ncbi:MAG: hypothetical protein WCK35_06155 [Chloroflexota bacterium]
MKPIVISELSARRFAAGLGRQAGLPGKSQALRAVEALQLDPLNVAARSQDIALTGRVLDYDPEYLHAVSDLPAARIFLVLIEFVVLTKMRQN